MNRLPSTTSFLGLVVCGCISYDGQFSVPCKDLENFQTAASSFLEAQAYWDGNGTSGSPSIILNLTRQMIFYYKGNQLVGMSPTCTGKAGYSTPIGTFYITQKNEHHVSNLYGDFVDANGRVVLANISSWGLPPTKNGSTFRGASMPFFMRICGSIGIHGGFLPGVPDSHGCIRIPRQMAEIFFRNTPLGTPVSIVKYKQ